MLGAFILNSSSQNLQSAPHYNHKTLISPSSTSLIKLHSRYDNNKHCDVDPLQTWLLKDNIEYVATFITRLFNQSLASGQVPATFKSAYVVPRLKKPDLDHDDVKNYRPISNLPVLAKLLERIVAKQLVAYLNLHGLMPRLQSAYRSGHSTETALIKGTSDMLRILDNGDLATLTLLDLWRSALSITTCYCADCVCHTV